MSGHVLECPVEMCYTGIIGHWGKNIMKKHLMKKSGVFLLSFHIEVVT